MKIFRLLLFFVSFTLFFISCGKSDDLANAVPADASYVVHVNTESLIKKADWKLFENVLVSRSVSLVKAGIGKEDANKIFDAFIKDPNSIGLDVTTEGYIYVSTSSAGLVLKVNDAEKLKKAFVTFGNLEAVEDGGSYSIKLSNDAVIVWNKKTFLFYTDIQKSSSEDCTAQALAQLTQEKDKSINSIPSFSQFLKNRKDISMFYNYSALDMEKFIEMSGQDIPKGVADELKQLKGISSMAYVSFEKGEIVTNSEIAYENSDVEKKYKELSESVLGEQTGKQLQYLIGDPVFAISMNLKGEGIYNYMEKLGVWTYIDEDGGNKDGIELAKAILKNMEGDATFSLNNIIKIEKQYEGYYGTIESYTTPVPQFALFADSKDGKFILNKIEEAIKKDTLNVDTTFVKIDENTYSMDVNGTRAYLGVKDKTFFFTNDDSAYKNVKKGTQTENVYSKLAKGTTVSAAGKLDALKPYIKEELNDETTSKIILGFFDLFASYQIVGDKNYTGKGKIEMTNKDDNSLATICKYIDKTMAEFSESLSGSLF